MVRLVRALGCLCLLVAATASGAQAHSGLLDPGFGDGGRNLAPLPSAGRTWFEEGLQAARAEDGGTFVASSNTLLRYDRAGNLDADFGDGGRVAIALPGDVEFRLADLAAERSGGGVVLVGTAVSGPEAVESAAILRFTAGGRPNAGFDGDGALVGDLGFPAPQVSPGLDFIAKRYAVPFVETTGVAVDGAGDILVTGTYVERIGYCRDFNGAQFRAGFVVRLAPSGALDPSYGAGGRSVEPRLAWLGLPRLSVEGNLFYAGRRAGCESQPSGVGMLDPDGHPVPGFGVGGWSRLGLNGITDLAVDQQGNQFALGGSMSSPGAAVVKLTPSGRPRRSFGHGGEATVAVPGRRSGLSALAIGGHDEPLLLGTLRPHPRRAGARSFFALVRLGHDGALDRSLGRDGVVSTGFGPGASAIGRELTLFGQRVVAVGPAGSPQLPEGRGVALAAYRLP